MMTLCEWIRAFLAYVELWWVWYWRGKVATL